MLAGVIESSTRRLGVVWSGSAWREPNGTPGYALVAFDLDAPELGPRTLALPFFPHGVVPDPTAPHRAALFEKHGPGAAIVDLAAMEILRILEPAPGRQFYGHGAFSADGRTLWCTETDVRDGADRRGWLGVIDTSDDSRIGDLHTHGRAPHDCWLVDGALVVGNGGGAHGQPDPPSLVLIDPTTGACLERRYPPDPRHDVGHLAIATTGDVAIASAPRFGTPDPTRAPGGLVVTRRDAPAIAIDGPTEITSSMIGETLSVALHEPSGTIAATNPEGHLLSFWSIADGSSRGHLRIPNPRGVALTLDGHELVVSFGAQGKLVRIDVNTLQPVDVPGNRDGVAVGATGSHLLVHFA